MRTAAAAVTHTAVFTLQYLLPAVHPANASRWDLLVGHYLGVDHAGHTEDVATPSMAAKLAQIDSQVAQVLLSTHCHFVHPSNIP